ncbi:unnamed protein product [Candida verbasci]|uniref:Uncharacterized protein n=1 Tax=Candida verbasci TaxID=1227364 RepID=A0A9W4XAI4_9ASCO|nr:unnamed protein product [Candida verbasci]
MTSTKPDHISDNEDHINQGQQNGGGLSTTSNSEEDLKELIQKSIQPNSANQEQHEFNLLSKDLKLNRLNNLIEKSQIYSKIIADNILQSSLQQNNNNNDSNDSNNNNNNYIPNDEKENVEPDGGDNKRRKTTKKKNKKDKKDKKDKQAKKAKKDITSMLSTNISSSTKSKRDEIEQAQTTTHRLQPILVTGGTLKNYQLEGLEWLVTLYQNGLNGILADEMGLGKTLQCISFIAFLLENQIHGPFLIVVPLSTLSNWYNEFKRFTPKIKVLKYTGNKQERAEIKLDISTYDVFITSYELSIKDFKKLDTINWKYLIVDEGHRLKNSQCLLIKILKKLDCVNRLLLTGTPLQNNLNELWSLLNFILPDIFHDLELFQQWFNFDELTNLQNEIETDEETNKIIKFNIQETLIKNLHTILKPFILRRLKKDVIKDLPPKKEYLITIPLTKLQKKIYLDAINKNLRNGLIECYLKEFIEYNHKSLFKNFDIDNYLKNKDNLNSKRVVDSKSDKSYKEVESDDDDEFEIEKYKHESTIPSYSKALEQLNTIPKSQQPQFLIKSILSHIISHINHLHLQALKLVQLRNICNSPYLYYEPFMPDKNSDSQLFKILIENSAKFKVLNQILPIITKSHKVLIFSQFTRILDLLDDWLNYEGFNICRLDGSTAQTTREEQIQSFNNDNKYRIFLLSTRAGGLGINLTGADTVILFDSDWNPQMDLQAIDRVHRIGQDKPVKIFRFIIRNSIEELLISKSSSKRFLEKLVIQMGEFKFNKLKSIIGNTEDNADDLNVKELLELSKYNFKNTEQGKEEDDDQILLDDDEINEFLDRSVENYKSIDDSKFKNLSIFETVNNMDK